MMQVKDWFSRAHKGIVTRIAANGEVPISVKAILRLKGVGESFEMIIVAYEFHDICWSRAVGVNQGDVTLEATRIVVLPATIADARLEGGGAEIHSIILERSIGDAATACARRNSEVTAGEGEGVGPLVRDGFAVAAHGVD